MKLGLFDSGVGGLSIAKSIREQLPRYDLVYLGDSKRSPYGNLTQDTIYEYTRQGITWLFGHGASLVILACNTASSQALRRLQQEWLPKAFPDRRVLGVVVPIAQEVALQSKGVIGVVGTTATITSQAYIKELRKVRPDNKIIQVAIPELTSLIERNAPSSEILALLPLYLFPLKESGVDTLILACTHYPLVKELFQEIMGQSVVIPDTGAIVARTLQEYLTRHPDIDRKLSKQASEELYATGDTQHFASLAKRFLGHDGNPLQTTL